jgi:hypothetical protein
MGILVGALLAIGVGVLATTAGLDRDRAFYAVVTIVVASYYSLFAAMGGTTRVLVLESLLALVFVAAAVVGFRSSLWIVAAALAGHGVFDLVHDVFISNAGMPRWWPAFCATYDVVAGAYLAWLLQRGRIRVAP